MTCFDLEANARESEIDSLVALRASKEYCERRYRIVERWPRGSSQYTAYRSGTLQGIAAYMDQYMNTTIPTRKETDGPTHTTTTSQTSNDV